MNERPPPQRDPDSSAPFPSTVERAGTIARDSFRSKALPGTGESIGNDRTPPPAPRDIDDDMLRGWPLPAHHGGDKEDRGRVLIIAGSPEMPGVAVLCAEAALRAGAGKVHIATTASIAGLVAIAVPEARVTGLPQTADGGIAPPALDRLVRFAQDADAILVGPGLDDDEATCDWVRALLPSIGDAQVVLDAKAMNIVRAHSHAADPEWPEPSSPNNGNGGIALALHERAPMHFEKPVLMTPHAGEMAHLRGIGKDAIERDLLGAAREAAVRWNAVVALKAATTHIAAPDGNAWRLRGDNIGLAVSGSGDVLTGIIVGLLARGATLEQACAWGVALHARAASNLAERYGDLGYLPRELSAEIPSLMHVRSAKGGLPRRVR